MIEFTHIGEAKPENRIRGIKMKTFTEFTEQPLDEAENIDTLVIGISIAFDNLIDLVNRKSALKANVKSLEKIRADTLKSINSLI